MTCGLIFTHCELFPKMHIVVSIQKLLMKNHILFEAQLIDSQQFVFMAFTHFRMNQF